jgi:hypothetical protein
LFFLIPIRGLEFNRIDSTEKLDRRALAYVLQVFAVTADATRRVHNQFLFAATKM